MEALTPTNWTRWRINEIPPKFHQLWFEKIDLDFWYWFSDNFMNGLIAFFLVSYVILVWKLKQFMKDRKPYKLRIPMFVWNAFIGTLSIIVVIRASPEFWLLLKEPHGFYRITCTREGIHESSVFWAIVMLWSKPLFILDTVFLILRGKPVDALHIIHHSVSILVSGHLMKLGEPFMRWAAIANIITHAIDYPLLALRSLKIDVPKSRLIMAAMEVLQMVFVLGVSAYTLYLKSIGVYCVRHPISILVFYAVYLGLLGVIIATLLSPEYWKRGIKKTASPGRTQPLKTE